MARSQVTEPLLSPEATFTLRWVDQMVKVDRERWDALALPLATPFLEWDWLHAMEASGSITPATGWTPCHLTVYSGQRLVAAAPLYIKDHSAGEFVFDHPWAELARRLGIVYYPKLVGMTPVTPVTGYRFLIDPHLNTGHLTDLMIVAIEKRAQDLTLSGCHFLFVDPQWGKHLDRHGYSGWRHQRYLWENIGFTAFDDYLAIFNANQRRNIKRERASLQKHGLHITPLSGAEIPSSFIERMYRFYEITNASYGPWGCRYLNLDFFKRSYRHFRHRLLFIPVFRGLHIKNNLLAMAMLVTKGERLYGRYWGSMVSVPDLHFNTCYYHPVEWAIANGIRWFDPGMGSVHKARRGFHSLQGYSLHRFLDPRMRRIMRNNMEMINSAEQAYIDELEHSVPFRKE